MIKPLDETYRSWAIEFIRREWGSSIVVSRGKIHDAKTLSGFVALEGNKPIGLLLYTRENNECEIVSLNSLIKGKGIGTKLLQAVKNIPCRRLWTITTNDNLEALQFYQKRGFVLVTLYPNALEQSRKLKPEIPLVGKYGIPLRDEIELAIVSG